MFDLPTPELKFFADLSVQVDKPQEVGATVHGQRRVIPILGGEVHGNGWKARVLRGGADFQMIVNQSLAELASKTLSWISEKLFIGTGARHPDKVVMRFFEVM
ncbi:MAG: DUF3237 family protein [Betaproteobacteria bacterium]|nr:DUF3237 family protein [Betaproteobacteria bacterium]